MKETPCAYCGKLVARPDKEHVFPKCLYPASKGKSKVRRLTVPSCRDCNSGWADDEAHFRNILVVAGEAPNEVRRELWNSRVLSSFNELDGLRRRQDIIAEMKPVKVSNTERHGIYPGNDARVMRIVRKIIRGLSSYHGIMSPVSDKQVWADVLKYRIPQALLHQMIPHNRERDIVEYRYQVVNEEGVSSAWHMTFFERVTFVGLVYISESELI